MSEVGKWRFYAFMRDVVVEKVREVEDIIYLLF